MGLALYREADARRSDDRFCWCTSQERCHSPIALSGGRAPPVAPDKVETRFCRHRPQTLRRAPLLSEETADLRRRPSRGPPGRSVPTLPTPTTLMGNVFELKTVKERTYGLRQALPILGERPLGTPASEGLLAATPPPGGEIVRGLSRDNCGPASRFYERAGENHARARCVRAPCVELSSSPGRRALGIADCREQFFGAQTRVPHVQEQSSCRTRSCARDTQRAHARAASAPQPVAQTVVSDASTKLDASRFTSHSQGAGSVSSRSWMSNCTRRPGVPKPRKFTR